MSEKKESFDTANYESNSIQSSSIDENGVSFVYEKMTTGNGAFGIFYRAEGKKDGEDFSVNFYSVKLKNLFKKNDKVLAGKMIKIVGRGAEEERDYIVTLV